MGIYVFEERQAELVLKMLVLRRHGIWEWLMCWYLYAEWVLTS